MAPRRGPAKGRDENDQWREGALHSEDDGQDEEPAQVPDGPVDDVLDRLECYADSDRPKGSLLNIVAVLEHDPRWMRRVKFNQFSAQTELDRTPPAADGCYPQSDQIDGETELWLANHYRLVAPTARVAQALELVAHRHSHHPVRDYLRALEWDGTKRLSALFSRYFGAVHTDLVGKLGRCFLISLVARVMRPGCKVDTTPILAGGQGAYKSTGLRQLLPNPDWFSDTHLDLSSKDLFENIQGIWLQEIAELDAFKGREWSRIKGILSSPRDTWRRPYRRHKGQVDRQVVFAGTTNEDEFLGDPSGSRRFWPVRVSEVIVRAIMADRDQLWAEAYQAFTNGEHWWLGKGDQRELALVSEDFQVLDPWHDTVVETVEILVETTVSFILAEGIKKPRELWTPTDQSRVASILKRLGWTQHRPRTAEGKGRVWRRPVPEEEPVEDSS